MKRCLTTVALILIPTMHTMGMETPVYVSRYLIQDNKPTSVESFPLLHSRSIRFQDNVQRVQQAIAVLLSDTGYSLSHEHAKSDRLQQLLNSPIAAIQRNMGPMSVIDGIQTLVGPAVTLRVDPAIKRVALVEKGDVLASSGPNCTAESMNTLSTSVDQMTGIEWVNLSYSVDPLPSKQKKRKPTSVKPVERIAESKHNKTAPKRFQSKQAEQAA
ncbi:MAG: hypothetical protein OER96_09685 [Gammaproteobacteria bacterium]|nr:hypothetical protein [Gammaproteobacteria bacterium]